MTFTERPLPHAQSNAITIAVLRFPARVTWLRYGLSLLAVFALLVGTINVQAQIALGQSRTYSTLGQPLSATVDISAGPQDYPSISGRAYRIAPSGGVDPSITTRIVQGPNGLMVQLGSLTPVSEPFVDVVVELMSGTGASIARQYTILVNPEGGYFSPPVVAGAPRTAQRPTNTRPASGGVRSSAPTIDAQLARAKRELAELEKKLATIGAPPPSVGAPPLNPMAANANPETTATPPANPATAIAVVAPSQPSSQQSLNLPPTINMPKPGDVLDAAVKSAMSGLSNLPNLMGTTPNDKPNTAPQPPSVQTPTSPPTTASPPSPEPTPVITPPVANVSPQAPAQSSQPKPPPRRPATPPPPPPEKGLFGFDFLPSAESLGVGSLSSEMLMIGGGVLVLIALVAGFLIWRKRSAGSRTQAEVEGDTAAVDVFGGASDIFATEEPVGALASGDTTDVAEEPKIEPKKKKSFLSKLRRKKDDSDAEASLVNAAAASMAATTSAATHDEPSKPMKSANVLTNKETAEANNSAIERFIDDSAGVGENDFLGDLEHLSQSSGDQSTVLLSQKSDEASRLVSAREAPTALAPQPMSTTANAEDALLSFSDKITRINPQEEKEEEDNPVNTAFTEMLSEDIDRTSMDVVKPMKVDSPSASAPVNSPRINDESFGDTRSKKMFEEGKTELSIDDLDFSSEKTMIMPNLQEMVKEAEAEAATGGDFDFKLDLKPAGTAPKTAVPSIADDHFDKKSTGGDLSATKNSAPMMEVPSMLSASEIHKPSTTTMATASPPSSSLDIPDLGALSLDALAKKPQPTTPQDNQATKKAQSDSKSSMDADKMFDLPSMDLSSMKFT